MEKELPAILSEAFALLASGAEGDGAAFGRPWRTLTLATTGPDQRPQLRSVVLRAFDPAARWLDVHTDARSAKVAALRACPHAALHGWDPEAKVQLRVAGSARLHSDDDIARAAWHGTRPRSRETYAVVPGPGTVLADPQAAGRADAAFAQSVFSVIRIALEELEWLHLEQGSHRRARFCWNGDHLSSMWLVP